jgi:hypothetical protein
LAIGYGTVLNDIWLRELSNLEHLRDQTHLLPKLIFAAAHARFLTAIELGFSYCIGDAYSILRDGIEAVAHAHKILKEPSSAGAAWSEKHQGKAQKTAYNKIFEENKKDNLFPDEYGLRKLHTYYAQFCELATHTSVTSIGKSFEDMTEVVQRSDSSYIRCTYSFDETGRPTGQINYDASGKILDKATNEYRNDSHGNWIEKKAIVWDTKSDPKKAKIVEISLRTINYY